MTTPMADRVFILSQIFEDEDRTLNNFKHFHNLGLPFAYGVEMGWVSHNEYVDKYINQTFDWLMLGAKLEDTGYKTWSEVKDAWAVLNPEE